MNKFKKPGDLADPQKGSNKSPIKRESQDLIKGQQALDFIKQGKLKEAEQIYRELISKGTTHSVFYGNLGVLCGKRGNQKERIFFLNKALNLNPNYPQAQNNLGNALQDQGELKLAIECYKKALKLDPNFSEGYNNLGNTFLKQGDIKSSIAYYQKALILQPNHPNAHGNLGNAFLKQGDIKSSIDCYKKALELQPNMAKAHNNLGNALKEQGEFKSAITCYQQALKLNPNYAVASNNLGNVLTENGDVNTAICYYQKALKLDPNFSEAYNNLGNALKEQDKLNSAIVCYQKALKLEPNSPEVCSNLGNAFQEKGDINSAIDYFQKAIKLKKNLPEAHYNLSNALLLIGEYEKGWLEYEYRSEKVKHPSRPHARPRSQRWQGKRIEEEERLLVISEQGLGDTIQFMRYIPSLKEKGIEVSFFAQQKLHSLIKISNIDINPLTPKQVGSISKIKWIPLLSLPRYLGVNPNNPIISSPYITAKNSLIAKWRKILSKEKKPIIGINWQGKAEIEKNNLKGRSMPLEAFSHIIKNNNYKFLSLQKGFGSEQLQCCSFIKEFINCQNLVDQVWDFAETAAIIANCDLIITTDTSIAHLAGAMGQSTWLLLHSIPDWRWGLNSKKTFWYPSIRLFRQKERKNWEEVMKRVSIELHKMKKVKNSYPLFSTS